MQSGTSPPGPTVDPGHDSPVAHPAPPRPDPLDMRPAARMTDTHPVAIPDPRPPRRMVFALTPLADVMFQLLIFFMLSTTLAPYALVPLSAAAASDAPGAPPARDEAPSATPAPARGLIWHVAAGRIREGATSHPIATLPDLLARHVSDGIEEIMIFAAPDARTQDLATVLEEARLAQVPRVRLIPRPGRGMAGGMAPPPASEIRP